MFNTHILKDPLLIHLSLHKLFTPEFFFLLNPSLIFKARIEKKFEPIKPFNPNVFVSFFSFE